MTAAVRHSFFGNSVNRAHSHPRPSADQALSSAPSVSSAFIRGLLLPLASTCIKCIRCISKSVAFMSASLCAQRPCVHRSREILFFALCMHTAVDRRRAQPVVLPATGMIVHKTHNMHIENRGVLQRKSLWRNDFRLTQAAKLFLCIMHAWPHWWRSPASQATGESA